jgi:hypothetical protein
MTKNERLLGCVMYYLLLYRSTFCAVMNFTLSRILISAKISKNQETRGAQWYSKTKSTAKIYIYIYIYIYIVEWVVCINKSLSSKTNNMEVHTAPRSKALQGHYCTSCRT